MLKGSINIPADKSISQRALILSTLTNGKFNIDNFCISNDCLSTLNVVKNLGVKIDFLSDRKLKVENKGLIRPLKELECNNSGTCMRMMTGVLSGQNFDTILIGDESLSKRPMKRIIEPLSLMGARIESNSGFAPLKISSSKLKGIEYSSKTASAQVKSAILLASLQAEGKTIYTEPFKSRNHTEIMLQNMGADIFVNKNTIEIKPSKLSTKDIKIVGDFSSAAFFITAALIVPDSEIILKNVGLNPTRCGFLEIAKNMGANIEIIDFDENNGEPFGDLKIKTSSLNGITVKGEIIPNAIDELPLLALLGARATGKTILKDAQELRKKESDRIDAICKEMKKIGIDIEETQDGFIVEGIQEFKKGNIELDSHKDHRIAMCLYIASMLCKTPNKIKDFNCINISFPEFESLMKELIC